jgi:hypothetical protein
MSESNPTMPDDSKALDRALRVLVELEAGDTPVLSCYLDAREGPDACAVFLERSTSRFRAALSGAALFDFDAAVSAVEQALGQASDPRVQGLVLFARGPVGGRFVQVLRLAVPLDNAVTLYRRPEIAPLLAVRAREAGFTLLHASGQGVEVMQVDAGLAGSRGWVRRSRVNPAESTAGRAQWPRRRARFFPDRGARALRRILARQCSGPLVVAGSAETTETLCAGLPRRLAARLVARVVVETDAVRAQVVALAREQVAAHRDGRSSALVRQVLGTARQAGLAVTGAHAAGQALDAGRATLLLLAGGDVAPAASPWHPRIELAHEALRRCVPVIQVESAALRAAGGVACLVEGGPRRGAMAAPLPCPQLGLAA